MAASRSTRRRGKPATTDEGREQQLISLAYDLAEKQIFEGSAAAQVITHFLKLASSREKLEQEKLKRENLLLSAKIDQIASGKRMEELYVKAIDAMKEYSGKIIDSFRDDEDDY